MNDVSAVLVSDFEWKRVDVSTWILGRFASGLNSFSLISLYQFFIGHSKFQGIYQKSVCLFLVHSHSLSHHIHRGQADPSYMMHSYHESVGEINRPNSKDSNVNHDSDSGLGIAIRIDTTKHSDDQVCVNI